MSKNASFIELFLRVGSVGETVRGTVSPESNDSADELVRPEAISKCNGEVAEWSKAPVSKTGNRETGSRVQIPSSPQEFKTKF